MMTPSETRLVIEVALVTMAFAGLMAMGLWLYVQARRNTPGAVAELSASNDDLSRRVRSLERDRERDHLLILRFQTRLEAQTNYSRALADYAQMLAERLRMKGETNIPPAPMPPAELDRPFGGPDEATTLARRIQRQFSVDELNSLAFDIGVSAEEIPGQTRQARARELVELVARRGLTDDLIRRMDELRPKEQTYD